jgi:predicted Rossmann fold flavoprotein
VVSAAAFDVLVIGGGAAGLMCALTAGHRGKRVKLIEHANRCGKKILMSGGGRCNFTNTGTSAKNFLSDNPKFCKSALARYTPTHFIEMVERHHIGYHEKELGQLFCDLSSKQIVQMLLAECASAGVEIALNCEISTASQNTDFSFSVTTNQGLFTAPALVVASGGLSIPSMGASGFGYQLARQFGHTILPTRAGLVPLTLSGSHQEQWADLSGVSLPISASCNGAQFDNFLLITHRGLSGPAILQISNYWQPKDDLRLNLLPQTDLLATLIAMQAKQGNAQLSTALAELLPKRLAQRLCEQWLSNKPLRQYQPAEFAAIAEQLGSFPITANGTEGYRTAEVTLGGVDTRAVSSSTMQSTLVPGLYFIGEVLDVTGWLGGYNFQWAWASGYACGNSV